MVAPLRPSFPIVRARLPRGSPNTQSTPARALWRLRLSGYTPSTMNSIRVFPSLATADQIVLGLVMGLL